MTSWPTVLYFARCCLGKTAIRQLPEGGCGVRVGVGVVVHTGSPITPPRFLKFFQANFGMLTYNRPRQIVLHVVTSSLLTVYQRSDSIYRMQLKKALLNKRRN
jgi:hypothetical protein